MLLYFRFLFSVIMAMFQRKPIDPHKPLDLTFHALPTDIDFAGHLNNARYPSFMDIGVFTFMAHTGILQHMRALGGVPVKSMLFLRFRKPLRLFNKFTLRVEIICADKEGMFIDYKFIKDGFVMCHAIEKSGIYIPGKGLVTPHDFFQTFANVKDFPPPPPHIKKIMETEDEMKVLIPKT